MADRTQFNLDRQLASWRQRVLDQEQLRPQDAEELESHLQESIADLETKGLSDEEAFLIAARRLGDGESLGREYGKVHRGGLWLRRIFWMVLGVVALNLCLGMATAAGWLVVAAVKTWLPQTEFLGYVAIAVRIGLFALLLGGTGVLLWLLDRGALGWMRRFPVWIGLGLGFLSVLVSAAPQLGVLLLARVTPVEAFGRIMLTSSIGSMVLTAAMAFAFGLGLGILIWHSRRPHTAN